MCVNVEIIVMQPQSSETQKEKFRTELDRMINNENEEIRDKFNSQSQIDFDPITDLPLIYSNIHLQPGLSKKFKSDFTALMNKYKNITL